MRILGIDGLALEFVTGGWLFSLGLEVWGFWSSGFR